MTRERAEELLLKYGQDNDYLVRERDSQPGSYAISIRYAVIFLGSIGGELQMMENV